MTLVFKQEHIVLSIVGFQPQIAKYYLKLTYQSIILSLLTKRINATISYNSEKVAKATFKIDCESY